MPARGPSLLALTERAVLLFFLIWQAAWLYLRNVAHERGWWRSDPARLEAHAARFARRFTKLAMRFRGGLIKMGQVASLRIDVVPEAITDELARLQDRVDPHPLAEILAQVEAELGRPADACFARFDPVPLAAASLGQVHTTWNAAGEKLAVKVLYPGVERSVAVDLAMTRLALWLFNFVAVADLMQVYREVRGSLLGEMDYVREGRAAEEVTRNLSQDAELFAALRIPRIHWDTTTRRVLTMEFIEGEKINEHVRKVGQGPETERLVLLATRAFLHQIFRDGFFHCDPHPGNLMATPDGRVGIIDFGMNKRIDATVLAAVRKNVLASVTRNADLYVESLLEAGVIRSADGPVVKQLAELSFDPKYYNLTPQEMMNLDFGEYFSEMRGKMKKIKSFQLPDGLVMWSRAFSLLYGLNAELAPGVRPLEVIGPYVLEFMQSGAAGEEPAQSM